VPTRILGFSWSDDASPAAVSAMRWASRFVVLSARDPVSRRRLLSDGAHGVEQTADIVFAMTDRAEVPDVARWLTDQRAAGRRIVALNVSGLVGAILDQRPGLTSLVRQWLDDGWSVLVVPHVTRALDDDLAECSRVADAFAGDARVLLIGRRLRPAEVRWLGASVDFVVAGRMHLSVMALAAGTTSVTLATRGKIEGLCELADPLAAAVATRPGFEDDVRSAMERLLETPPERTAEVPDRLRRLALRNFVAPIG
jgi:polysaccharide pyruvyl transferase WcaK-like protein